MNPSSPANPGSPGRKLGLLSVVAPVLNEADTVHEFYDRVVAALTGIPFELLLVDDGSTDESPEILRELAASDVRVRPVTLSRNFGHQAAITAGLDKASGDAVAILDSDLQDPPEVIPRLLERWSGGIDVVYAVREERRGETRLKLSSARWFYRVFSRLTQLSLEHETGDFRLLDRRAVDALLSMPERHRFLRGMSIWVGFSQVGVSYRRDARFAGESKYTLTTGLRLSLDAILSFSHAPLRLATLLGFLCSALALLAIPVAIAARIAGESIPGTTMLLIVVLLLGGMQLIAVGIIGEYLGRVYDEVRQRPLYVIRDQSPAGDPDGSDR